MLHSILPGDYSRSPSVFHALLQTASQEPKLEPKPDKSRAMDITNIPQNLIKALEQKNTEQLAALSRVLNLVLGKTVMATVTSTEPVTEPEREALLKQTAAALAQLNKQVAEPAKISPALKAEISRLMQQQDLLKMPELKWVSLLVNNRPQVTYTDRPLVAGQSISIQLQSPNKLVLLDLPELDPNNVTTTKGQAPTPVATPLPALPGVDKNSNQPSNTPVPNAKNIAILNQLLKNALAETGDKPNQLADAKNLQIKIDGSGKNSNAVTNPILETSSKLVAANTGVYNAKDVALKFSAPDSKNISQETSAAKTLVSEHLRNLLPHRDTPNVLFSAVAQLRQLPPTSRVQLFSPSVEQALKSVAEKMRAPDNLSQPKVLAQALKNSGVFFEHTLNQLVKNNNALATDTVKFSGTLHHTYQHDLKGALLTLLNRVTQDLTGDKRPLTNEQTQKLMQQVTNAPLFSPSFSAVANTFGNKYELTQAIGVFMQQLMQKPVKELSNKDLRTQLLTLLQQHSVHSLARIQLQQLHAINHELDTRDSATPNASWQLEIPVKHHTDVQHLHVRIDREWVDDKSESESNAEKSNTKIKQWSVTLRFDLPTLGEFCAQLSIINRQVSATLWAAQEKTFAQVRDHIENLRKQLESEGMSVKYLQCMRGIPPEKPMALSYSLIDIST